MDLMAELTQLNDKVAPAGAQANRQTFTKFAGVTEDDAVQLAQTLITEHGFTLDQNAIVKGGANAHGERIVTVQVKSLKRPGVPTAVFTRWSSGKAMITNELPCEHGLDEYEIAA